LASGIGPLVRARSAAARGRLARDAQAEPRVVRVFVAAHVRLYREALVDVLAGETELEIVGSCGARAILARVAEVEPDVVLLDPAAAESLELIRELADRAVGMKIVALASSEDEHDMLACAEAGVSGFVTREESVADLVATIQRVQKGELACSPKVAGALLRRVTVLAANRPAEGSEHSLTAREREVAALLDEGLSNKQIAARLHVEVPTVKHHVHHILHKLGVASRTEAVARLRRRARLVTAHPWD
jgi:two-component system, NarL family, nitrate/nitrite response regulator NarL